MKQALLVFLVLLVGAGAGAGTLLVLDDDDKPVPAPQASVDTPQGLGLVTIEGTWHYRDPFYPDYSETDLSIACGEDIGPHRLIVFGDDLSSALIGVPIVYQAGEDECFAPFAGIDVPAADIYRLELSDIYQPNRTSTEIGENTFTVYVEHDLLKGDIRVVTTVNRDGTYDTRVEY